ncbi:biotin-independent malonate decarboxylase subunit beta [Orrella sp. JC864]|uniref:biotin-independent malonate decarboxylase subunit beta n=1 Tax=Orrella sp. JC864 TaxID=3120298 RepID=UPI003FA6ED49
MRRSYYEASARERIAGLLDPSSFRELMGPAERRVSPHLQTLDLPVAFDDGVVVGEGRLDGRPVLLAAQEGEFMGGAVGEVHGAKIVGLLQRAERLAGEGRPHGVLLLLETGGVRLQEANAGLIAVSEIMRAILTARAAGVRVLAAIGGRYGCFGGMGIAVSGVDAIVMSEQGRLGLSGPEVIETSRGVEEFDSRDRAKVWRTVGGKHRYLLGDCQQLVEDDIAHFRAALSALLQDAGQACPGFSLQAVQAEHALLQARLERFGQAGDGLDIWQALGWEQPEQVPVLECADFLQAAQTRRAR